MCQTKIHREASPRRTPHLTPNRRRSRLRQGFGGQAACASIAPLRRVRRSFSEGGLTCVPFASSDVVAVLHREHEHAAIADLTGSCGGNDGFNHFFRDVIVHHDFD